jgi:uncharacterized protein YndB with AHSA1/START domain
MTTQIESVARRLGTRTMPDGDEAMVLVISQTYDGDVADVWDAVTNPERIPRWFLPVSGDLEVGGRYRIEGNAEGEVLTCAPPRAFSITWEYGGDVSWVEVDLTPAEGGTTLELRHIAKPTEHWKEFGPGAVGIGWDTALLGLAQHLGSGGGVKPEEAMAWMASPEGVEFLTASSEGWYEADVARGTDAAVARAAADATLAAYTATEPPESGD